MGRDVSAEEEWCGEWRDGHVASLELNGGVYGGSMRCRRRRGGSVVGEVGVKDVVVQFLYRWI